jgi:hypothetical protein
VPNDLSKYSTEELEAELKRRKLKDRTTKAKKYTETISDDELDDLENIEFNKLKKMGRS